MYLLRCWWLVRTVVLANIIIQTLQTLISENNKKTFGLSIISIIIIIIIITVIITVIDTMKIPSTSMILPFLGVPTSGSAHPFPLVDAYMLREAPSYTKWGNDFCVLGSHFDDLGAYDSSWPFLFDVVSNGGGGESNVSISIYIYMF